MKRVIVILDSVSYDLLMETETPNIDSLGEVRLAYSHGSWTLPSIASLINGHPPACYGKKFIEPNPFLLREHRILFYTSNDWVRLLLEAYRRIYCGIRVIFYDYRECINEMIDDLKTRRGSYLAFLHVMETHYPYTIYKGEKPPDTKDPKVLKERQKRALKYVDEALGRLFSIPNLAILVTSDHGQAFDGGELHGNFDGIFRPELFRVFIVAKNWPLLKRGDDREDSRYMRRRNVLPSMV